MDKNILNVFSENDIDGLTKVVEKLEQSQFDYMEIDNGSMKIVIGKNGMEQSTNGVSTPVNGTATNGAISNGATTDGATAGSATVAQDETVPQEAPVTEEPVEEKSVDVADDEVLIKATTAGLYYAQSEPGAPPYVQLGDQVEEDTTVGLIEIMKVYSAITAGVSGVITEIHVENEQLIEYGQPLFTVKKNS